MEAYSGFAEVYDLFMDNVPYEIWGEYLLDRLLEYGIRDGLVLDLGCGTGKMTRFLAKEGYDMIGVDVSQEMLGIAAEKESEGKPILYLNQDMREFELYGTVRAVVSVCDTLNYLTEQEDLLSVFKLVNNYLDPGGIFIFEMNTIYKYEVVLGENTICENREECSFIWENYYDKESRINEYDMTFFVRDEDNRYEKFQETHYQKGYDLKEIRALLEMAGLEFVACFGEDTLEFPKEDCERAYFIARECKKAGSRGVWKSEIVNA